MRFPRIGHIRVAPVLVALTIVLLPGIVLAPAWRLCGLGAGEDDILYYYPSRVFFHESLRAGHWPWINPWIGLDRPYAVDPQSALWYPFTWLFALLPPRWAYAASLWAHYSLALWGTYRLLRSLELGRRAAVLGGVAFAFCGFLLAHRAHFAMQHAAAWTPWVFWRVRRYAADGLTIRLLWATLTATGQCLSGHVQIAALTGLGLLVFLLFERRQESGTRRRTVLLRWLLCWVGAAGLFAVQWLPTIEFLRLCTRAERGFAQFVENSWYPSSAVGWLLPMFFGQRTPNFFDQPYWGPSHQVEQFGYAGIIPLVLALLALRRGWRGDARRRPWVMLAAFALLLALGQFGPVCPLLYWIPGSSLFRVPARALLLFNLAVAVLAACVLHDLGASLSPARARLRAAALRWTRRPVRLAAILVAAPWILVAATLPLLSGETRAAAFATLQPWKPALWVPFVAIALSLWTLRCVVKRWQQPALLWLLTVLVAIDLGVVGWTIDVPAGPRSPTELLAAPGRAAWLEHLGESSQRLWVVTARSGGKPGEYLRPLDKGVANTNALVHVPSLTDYGPLQPTAIVRRFGFQFWGETERAAELLIDSAWMRAFNVGWVLLCEPHWPAPTGCELIATTPDGMRLFHNPSAAGTALFEDPTQPGAIRYVESSPHAFTVHVDTWPAADRDGDSGAPDPKRWPRVMIARLALPGWRARMNDQVVPLETMEAALLAVRVPPGRAFTIECSYFPPGLIAGATISLLSLLVLVLFALVEQRRTTAPATAGLAAHPPTPQD